MKFEKHTIDSSVQSIASALLLVLFLIYLNNEFAILSRLRRKQEEKAKGPA